MPDDPPAKSCYAVPLLATSTACYLVGYLGSIGMMQGLGGWYESLEKPGFSPPNWSLAPVWTVLYGLMGFALWTVWREPSSPRRSLGLSVFAVQLLLNALWCWLFFAWQRLPLAFAASCALVLALLFTILVFYKLVPRTALLLVPCLAWALYIALFGFGTWRINMPHSSSMPPEVRKVP